MTPEQKAREEIDRQLAACGTAEDAVTRIRAAVQRRGREIAAKQSPRMLTEAERDFLRNDKVQAAKIIRAYLKAK